MACESFMECKKLFCRSLPRRERRAEKTKGRLAPAFFLLDRTAFSIPGGGRAAPAEAVVHADLDGVLVVAEAGADHVGRTGLNRGVAEIVVLVLGLVRPVWGKQIFEAGAD